MTHVHFSLPADFDEPLWNNLPVRILDREMILIKEAIAGAGVELATGSYIAQTILPSGRPAHSSFDVPPDQDGSIPVILKAAGARLAPRLRWAAESPADPALGLESVTRDFLSDSTIGFEADIPRLPDAKVELRSPTPEQTDVSPQRLTLTGGMLHVSPGPPLVLCFLQPGQPVWNIRLPVSEMEGVELEFRFSDQDWFPRIRLPDPRFDLLLRYAGSGQTGELAHVTAQIEAAAAGGIEGKAQRPMMAALGLYARLRLGSIEGCDGPTRRLNELFPDLADGYAIRGEYLARKGEHSAALERFAALQDLGSPVFTAGFRYLSERLSGYRGDLGRIAAVAGAADLNRPLLTYSTDMKGRPGREPLHQIAFESASGSEITFER